jgi:hypothetical protein
MEAKQLMNPNSLMFEADSTLDKGTFYPLIEPCVIANHRAMMFAELHFGSYVEAIIVVIRQNKLGETNGGTLLTSSYGNIQKAKSIVANSILNN